METSCTFGFEDLFWAAHGRAWTALERRALEEADQDRRNALVRGWARAAGDVRVEDRPGTDGDVYAAFVFERPDWWSRLAWRPPMRGDVALEAFGGEASGAGGAAEGPAPIDPAAGPVVAVVTRTGGPLVPGKAAAATHGRDPRDAIVRLRAAIRGHEPATVHVAVADAAAGDLAGWIAAYLRCPVV
jgi:hypothetical protein